MSGKRGFHQEFHQGVVEYPLVLILAGLPVVATLGGWLSARREPSVITKRPLE